VKLDRKELQKLIKLEMKQIIIDEDALFRDYHLPGDDDDYGDYSLSYKQDACECGSCEKCTSSSIKANDDDDHKHSSYMSRPQLAKIAKYASHLLDMIDEDEELEDWQESKIAQMAQMMGDIYHSLEYDEEYDDYDHDLDKNDITGIINTNII
jgi:hypothetical protein